jgi:hypothetical protein
VGRHLEIGFVALVSGSERLYRSEPLAGQDGDWRITPFNCGVARRTEMIDAFYCVEETSFDDTGKRKMWRWAGVFG